MVRKLTLKPERLAELTTEELDGVVAGAQPPQPTTDCPDYTYYCLTGYAMCSRLICA